MRFPVSLEVHNQADTTGLVKRLWPYLESIPTVTEFKKTCDDMLTYDQLQIFIRRYQLDKPDAQKIISFESVAQEIQGSTTAIATTVGQAERLLCKGLLRVNQMSSR